MGNSILYSQHSNIHLANVCLNSIFLNFFQAPKEKIVLDIFVEQIFFQEIYL